MSRQSKSEICYPKSSRFVFRLGPAWVACAAALISCLFTFSIGCNSQTQSASVYKADGSVGGSGTASANVEETTDATSAQVHQFCGACHAYPPPEPFPRKNRRFEVMQGYGLYEHSNYDNPRLRGLTVPPPASVIEYFEKRAPEELPRLPAEPPLGRQPVAFDRRDISYPAKSFPAVSNVNLVHLTDAKRLDLLVCDMRSGEVLLLKPYEKEPTWKVLAKLANPCHAEVVDLNGDGIKDLIVADLGNLSPTNEKVGRVVWLRGNPDGTFTPFTLLEGVGRVADVQAADFNGDGKIDLIAGVFGWRFTGEIIYLENQTTDWKQPKFARHVFDDRQRNRA